MLKIGLFRDAKDNAFFVLYRVSDNGQGLDISLRGKELYQKLAILVLQKSELGETTWFVQFGLDVDFDRSIVVSEILRLFWYHY